MYQKKYLKYKEKYLNLKKQLNGQFGGLGDEIINREYTYGKPGSIAIECRFPDHTIQTVFVPNTWTVKDLKENLYLNKRFVVVRRGLEDVEDDETVEELASYGTVKIAGFRDKVMTTPTPKPSPP